MVQILGPFAQEAAAADSPTLIGYGSILHREPSNSLPSPSCRVRSRPLNQASWAAETAGGGSVAFGMTSWDAGWKMLGYFVVPSGPRTLQRRIFASTMGISLEVSDLPEGATPWKFRMTEL